MLASLSTGSEECRTDRQVESSSRRHGRAQDSREASTEVSDEQSGGEGPS